MWRLGLKAEKPYYPAHGYIEKIEYWALVWGTAVMAMTGTLLWFNNWTLSMMPKVWMDVTRSIHYYEAVLATARNCDLAHVHRYLRSRRLSDGSGMVDRIQPPAHERGAARSRDEAVQRLIEGTKIHFWGVLDAPLEGVSRSTRLPVEQHHQFGWRCAGDHSHSVVAGSAANLRKGRAGQMPTRAFWSSCCCPGVFFAGLALIPLGIHFYRVRHRNELPPIFPEIDLQNARFRRLVLFIAVTTVLNLIIGAQLSYRAVTYMESATFCGQTCHTVMKPEYTAYQNSPHARVACVNCHIGPGANWFVKSKLSGSWQLISVTFNLYERPIPTPVKALRPARGKHARSATGRRSSRATACMSSTSSPMTSRLST